jgi:putative MATE family efflux protein
MAPNDSTPFRRGAAEPHTPSGQSPGQSTDSLGVWALAWPTIVGFGAQTFVRFADFVMVGGLGPEALAAVGLGGQVYWLVQAVANLVPTGLAAVVARAVGAGDDSRSDAALRQGILLASLLAVVTTIVGLPFTRFSIAIYGVDPGVVEMGSDYVYWMLWGTLPFSLSFVFGSALRAAGDVRTPLYVGLFANVLNVGLNWVLIYGNLGAPALGVAGAAMASSIVMLLQIVAFFWLWQRGHLILKPHGGSFKPDRALCRRLFLIGYPAAIEQLLFQIGLLGFQRIMSLYGTAAIAAYNVGAQILSLSFIPGIGFATAASTLVGQHLGSDDPETARRAGWRATRGAVVSMTVIGLFIVALASPLSKLFSDDAEVVALTIDLIWILAAVQPLMAIEFAVGGSLRGAGDTFYPMATVFYGLFLARLVPATILGFMLDAPLQLVWCALIGDYAIKAVLLIRRFRGGRWTAIEA